MSFKTRPLGWIGICAVIALTACGGGGGDPIVAGTPAPAAPTPTPTPAPVGTPPGGLYVGYYQEDPLTNPEDPTPGAFALNLPAGNGDFSGSMFFTYVGCQTSNVGAVGGNKNALALSGTWSGSIDGLAQSGSYSGSYDTAQLSYSGTYLNAGGKQFRDLRPCIQYTIAPNGTWEMFPIDSASPATFTVAVATGRITWPAVSGAAFTLVYVLDPAIARSTGNPVLWQTVIGTSVTSVDVPASVALALGTEYVAAVGVSDNKQKRLAFGSKRFTR